jgi:hypothetical protein
MAPKLVMLLLIICDGLSLLHIAIRYTLELDAIGTVDDYNQEVIITPCFIMSVYIGNNYIH